MTEADVMTADETQRLAQAMGVTRVQCGSCRQKVPVAGDREHLVARSITNTHFVVLCLFAEGREWRVS